MSENKPPVSTRRGDDGTTTLLGAGRLSKSDVRIIVLGDVDEASSSIGIARAESEGDMAELLIESQRLLYRVMGDVAMPDEDNAVGEADVERVEALLEEWRDRTEIPNEFVVPGGSRLGALLDVARSVTRRAERSLVAGGYAETHPDALKCVNRLSDILFVAARNADGTYAPPESRATLKPRLLAALGLLFLLAGCSGEPEPEGTNTGSAPARPEGPAEATREPAPSYGYTYGQPSGNRYAEGEGRLPESRPVDVRLGGEPAWVVGVPLEEDTAWVVALKSGRLDAFRLDSATGTVEPWLVAPDELPAGTPPIVSSGDDGLRLLVPPAGSSTLTHPVPLGDRLLGISGSGRLFVEPGGELSTRALPDARVTRSGAGSFAVLTEPTTRYDHGVLGDSLEAGSIAVLEPGTDGPEVVGRVRPASGGVFELLAPLWFEAEPGGEQLLAVTESTAEGGARISAYRPNGDLAAAGPFFGEPLRWRHLLAAGPFGPNGEIEIAATRTPHTDGAVEFYRPNLEAGSMDITAELPGYATHTIYSRNLDAAHAGDLDGDGRWELLVPNQSYTEFAAIRRTESGAEAAWTLPLGDTLATNIASATDSSGRLTLAAGRADGILRIWP